MDSKPKQAAPLRVYRVTGQGKAQAATPEPPEAAPATVKGTGLRGLAGAFVAGVAVGMAAAEQQPAAEPAHVRLSLDDDTKEGRECEQDRDFGR